MGKYSMSANNTNYISWDLCRKKKGDMKASYRPFASRVEQT
jgi:hypothetical protein